ncbi:dihydropteroate synthase [Anaeromicrobium sediminis]|uniref:Dihydropteroate synthase n=1 Tax=Anaeromicrobium sediminis TaxID=1478221 RepID=A0A267MES9_9FIRM|nr:dihydropteroate synthase [Anaeromicrobium sediminis]PAB58046.1 dihydropteroate synthase [Anaeromicrobium sediminis]
MGKMDLKCGKYTLNLGSKTFIMGILNVTPDSFSDGGEFTSVDIAIKHAKEMVSEGAHIIDVGGESTRPGSEEVGVEEEIKRIAPVIEALVREVDVPISIDTYKSQVAEKALSLGAHIVNDVWGMQRDKNMANVVAKYNVPIIAMHNQIGTEYSTDIMDSMINFFKETVRIGTEAGISHDKIVLDPGIGFGKTADHNIEVMSRLEELNQLGYPILLGTSRKSTIGKILDLPPKERVEGTIATSIIGIQKGVDILRVHDVKENLRAAKVADAIVRGVVPWTK